jgi:hypothetical protein
MDTEKYTCPVCDYYGLDEEPYWTFEICPRCHIEFGIEDHCTAGKDSEEYVKVIKELRERYLRDGTIGGVW